MASSAPIVRPGDVLVVSCDEATSPERAAEIRERILERLAGLADVAVMSGVHFEFVYRSDG